MAELDLPDGPRELFAAVRRPLAQAFGGEENIRFGGGTDLAARWAHRHNVDVDLFVADDPDRNFPTGTPAAASPSSSSSANPTTDRLQVPTRTRFRAHSLTHTGTPR